MTFKPRLIPLVFNGRKTVTRRSPDHTATAGQILAVQPGMGRPSMGRIEVMEARVVLLSEITEAEARREGFADLAEFRRYWVELHGEWRPDGFVKRIEFRVVDQTHELCECCGGAGTKAMPS